LSLQLPHMSTQAVRRYTEPARRFGKAPGTHHLNEHAHLIEIKHWIPL
jgi:hypothetical protein